MLPSGLHNEFETCRSFLDRSSLLGTGSLASIYLVERITLKPVSHGLWKSTKNGNINHASNHTFFQRPGSNFLQGNGRIFFRVSFWKKTSQKTSQIDSFDITRDVCFGQKLTKGSEQLMNLDDPFRKYSFIYSLMNLDDPNCSSNYSRIKQFLLNRLTINSFRLF